MTSGLFTVIGAVIAAVAGFAAVYFTEKRRRSERVEDEKRRVRAASRLACSDLDGAMRQLEASYDNEVWVLIGSPPVEGWRAHGAEIAGRIGGSDLSFVQQAMRQIIDLWSWEGQRNAKLDEVTKGILVRAYRDVVDAREILHPIAYAENYDDAGMTEISRPDLPPIHFAAEKLDRRDYGPEAL